MHADGYPPARWARSARRDRGGRKLCAGLTQSGVIRAVARLEEQVGVRLFDHNARAVTLTDEGSRRSQVHSLHRPEERTPLDGSSTGGESACASKSAVLSSSMTSGWGSAPASRGMERRSSWSPGPGSSCVMGRSSSSFRIRTNELFPLYVLHPSGHRTPAKVRAFVGFVLESTKAAK
jgi:hypothetical protein